jgi:sugar phosphate isomerase/epimerase
MIGANVYSYGLACGLPWLGHDKHLKNHKPLDVFAFMEKCRSVGLDGVQLQDNQLESHDKEFLDRVGQRAEELQLSLEISHSGSLNDQDISNTVRIANALGCKVMRTCIGMRLRETTIRTRDAWYNFRDLTIENARKLAELAEKFDIKIAIENHFGDVTAQELLEVIEVDTKHLGVCLDTANSFSVAQDPNETARILSKHVISSHLKDFLAVETPSGCTVYNVPLGQGQVDLPYIIREVQRYNPKVMFTIEMVSGRSFEIPFLEESFYSGFDQRDAVDLVKVLRLIRDNPKKLPASFLSLSEFSDDQLEYENSNVKECINYARDVLKL